MARDCGMVCTSDRILVAKASPPTENQPATLIFEPAHAPDVLTQAVSSGVSISFVLQFH